MISTPVLNVEQRRLYVLKPKRTISTRKNKIEYGPKTKIYDVKIDLNLLYNLFEK